MVLTALARCFRVLALVLMAVAAAFGIPLVIDPPPRDRVVEVGQADRKDPRRKPPRPR